MTSLTRIFAVTLLFLAVFLGAAVSMQWWLLRETNRLERETVIESGVALINILALSDRRPPAQWDDTYRAQLGSALGGKVEAHRGDSPTTTPRIGDRGEFRIEEKIPGYPGWVASATIRSKALDRMQLMHQRSLVAIILLAALLVLVPAGLAILTARRESLAIQGATDPLSAIRSHAAGFEQLARMSAEREQAFVREHGARVRVEEDLHVSKTLLDRSLAERVRLGQELHDNLCQTLYAVSLTLEGVAKKPGAPESSARLQQSIGELRRLNHEVRSYLRYLEPAQVKRTPLSDAIAAMLAALPQEDDRVVEDRLDEAVVALVPAEHSADVVNILREAISNSLRHGRARRITLRAERSDDRIAIAVVDDGSGFSPGSEFSRNGGHGMSNMEARARSVGGTLKITSSPGRGTRVLLTLPLAAGA